VRPQPARYDGHAEWYDETFPAPWDIAVAADING